jgi:hypothetical protein
MIENIIMLIGIGALNIVCFFIGAKIGQKVVKGEEIKAPEITIPTPIRDYQRKKQAEAEQTKIDTIMQNIETYNGTSAGQKDVL